MDRYGIANTTIDGTQHAVFDSAVLTYANTNETALIATPLEIDYLKGQVLEIKVVTSGSTQAKVLTIGVATSNEELTGANAVTQLTSNYWKTVAITLNAGVATYYYPKKLTESDLLGKYLYVKYQYAEDPVGDPTITVTLNKI